MKLRWPSGQRWDERVRLRNEDKRGNVQGGEQNVRGNFPFLMSWIFSLVPRKAGILFLRRGVQKHLSLPSASVLIISVKEEPCSAFRSGREIENSSRSTQLQFMEPGPGKTKDQHFLLSESARFTLSQIPCLLKGMPCKMLLLRLKIFWFYLQICHYPHRPQCLDCSFCKWETWNRQSWRFCWTQAVSFRLHPPITSSNNKLLYSSSFQDRVRTEVEG